MSNNFTIVFYALPLNRGLIHIALISTHNQYHKVHESKKYIVH